MTTNQPAYTITVAPLLSRVSSLAFLSRNLALLSMNVSDNTRFFNLSNATDYQIWSVQNVKGSYISYIYIYIYIDQNYNVKMFYYKCVFLWKILQYNTFLSIHYIILLFRGIIYLNVYICKKQTNVF